jgi:hypothetical protein
LRLKPANERVVGSLHGVRRKHLSYRCHKTLRRRENAYRSHSEFKHQSAEERGSIWDALRAKIAAEGFDSNQPITIQLLRKQGQKDQIKDGHHRLAIAIELGLKEIPIRFLFA